MSSVKTRIYQAALRVFAERGQAQLTVSELADAAGVARGTIYKALGSTELLFSAVTSELATEMFGRVETSTSSLTDPALRVSYGVRACVRRAHEEPIWGRFMVQYGLSSNLLQHALVGLPARDVQDGLAQGRFHIRPAQVQTVVAMTGGAILAAIQVVVEGRQAWRAAGSGMAELVLCSLGLTAEEAAKIAELELPVLAPPLSQKVQRKRQAGAKLS